jgi:hypothetical protein
MCRDYVVWITGIRLSSAFKGALAMEKERSHDVVDLGMALLTTFVHNDAQGYTAMTKDLPGGDSEAIAGLGRVGELLVGIIAEMLGASKEESVHRIAAALAGAD